MPNGHIAPSGHISREARSIPQEYNSALNCNFRFVSVHPLGVIIHQAPIQDDLLLVGGQTLQVQGDLLHGAVLADDLGGDGLNTVLHGGADGRDEDAIAHLILEGGVLVQGEGQNTPVDAVGAVALGGNPSGFAPLTIGLLQS